MDLEPEVWFRKELLSVMITELAKITENHETHVLTLYYAPLLKTEHWDQSDTVRGTRHYLYLSMVIIPYLHLYQINSQQNDYTHTKAKRLPIRIPQ